MESIKDAKQIEKNILEQYVANLSCWWKISNPRIPRSEAVSYRQCSTGNHAQGHHSPE